MTAGGLAVASAPALDAVGTLARLLGGALTLDDAASLLGESHAAVRARLTDAGVAEAVAREAVRLRLSGQLIEARAQSLMPAYLDRLEDLLHDPDTSASVTVEVGRELGALSGSKVRAEARAKVAAGPAGLLDHDGPLIVINLPNGASLQVGGHPDPRDYIDAEVAE